MYKILLEKEVLFLERRVEEGGLKIKELVLFFYCKFKEIYDREVVICLRVFSEWKTVLRLEFFFRFLVCLYVLFLNYVCFFYFLGKFVIYRVLIIRL